MRAGRPPPNFSKTSKAPVHNPMKRIYHPAKKKTILIVDDDQVVVHTYQEKFQGQGLKVEVVGNGHSAMQRLKKDPIDLVILDLCLPGMNGVEVLKSIRSEFDLQALPIIVFSNAFLGNLTRTAMEAGATKCATKADTTPAQLLDLVRELLAVDLSDPAAASSQVDMSNASGTLAEPSETSIQEKKDTTLLISVPGTLGKLRTCYRDFAMAEREDMRWIECCKVHRQVRSLAGSASFLGFRKLAQIANVLEALLIEVSAKPNKITPSVIRTIAQAIDTSASLFDRATIPEAEVFKSPKILVVDDETISRKMICSALGKANLRAISLDDPLAAQRLLEQDHFDLIFLDVEMPGLSGIEFCANIRKMETNRATPVVFVTSHSDFGNRTQSTLSGGNDFIAKPFLLVELAVKAVTWLFKESPTLLSTPTAQNSAPAEAGGHGSQLSTDHRALELYRKSPAT
jgi:CheY-like chemotaxis protein